jgi:hypothetical protein
MHLPAFLVVDESNNPVKPSDQQKLIRAELFICFFGITQQHVHLIPEPLAVIFDTGVNQLVQNGVVD